jgi:hypothetical protein
MKRRVSILFIATLVPVSGFAQIDLSGYWHSPMQEDALERGGGPLSGEYVGIPLNDAARMRADSWSASLLNQVLASYCKAGS